MAEATKKAPAKKTAAKKTAAPKAVVPEEPKAVEVSPKDTPTASFFGQEYEVTPEGGYRKK